MAPPQHCAGNDDFLLIYLVRLIRGSVEASRKGAGGNQCEHLLILMRTALAAWEMSRQKIPDGYQKLKYKKVIGKEGKGDDLVLKCLETESQSTVFGALAQAGKETADRCQVKLSNRPQIQSRIISHSTIS